MRSGVEIDTERTDERETEREDEEQMECPICGLWFVGAVCPICGIILSEVDNE